MSVKHRQLEFHLRPAWETCEHRIGFVTMAYVPAGIVCSDCELLISQYVPESPETLGYLSADWAWKLRGREWTTQRA